MKSYDYNNRTGKLIVNWDIFQTLSKKLSEKIAMYIHADFDCIVGISRSGLLPASLIAQMLRKDLYSINLTRRNQDKVVSDIPLLYTDFPDIIKHSKILIVDDVCDSGETLKIAHDKAIDIGCPHVCTASLIVHTWSSFKPNFYALETDELVVFPWNTQVLVNGQWDIHPEIKTFL